MENLCIVNLCYVMHQNTFRTLTYSELYLFRYTEAFSSILSTIKACSVKMRYIQHPVKASHTRNLALFQALPDVESEAY